MKHGISEQEWLEFLDGLLNPEDSARIREHVGDCQECAVLCGELEAWRDKIERESDYLRAAVSLPETDLDRMLEQTIRRIRADMPSYMGAGGRWNAAEGLTVLRCLTGQFSGRRTADAAIDLALRRSTAGGEWQLTPKTWPVFVSNLSETFSSICGVAAGRLVDRAGLYFAAGHGAE